MIRALLTRLPGNTRFLRRGLGAGAALCFGGFAVAAAEPSSEAQGEVDAAAAEPAAPQCGDFSRAEDDKSLVVHPSEGLTMILQSSVGGGMRDAGTLMAQLSYAPTGTQAVCIVGDQRGPRLQAVLAPGPEGRQLRLSTTAHPAAGLSVDLETSVASSGAWSSAKATARWEAADFWTEGALTLPLERGAPQATLAYHQSLGAGTGCTAGGTLQALLHPAAGGGALPDLLPPRAQQLFWGTYGSWTSASRNSAAFVRYAQQPRSDGPPLEATSLSFWRRVNKGLELGADASCANSGPFTQPVHSGAGVGMRVTFQGPGTVQGLAPVLTAHASTDMVVGVSLQVPSAAPASNTFLRTTLTTVLDHRNRDYKAGASVEMYY